jgi:tRNA-dihydrouridine synthase B
METKKEFSTKACGTSTTCPEVHQNPCRDLPGWLDAPLPPCRNGDLRGLVWCCKIDKGGDCRRDEYLKKLGMTPQKFIEIKEKFSERENWKSEGTCWKSLAYCCMRFEHTCWLRDNALKEKYPKKTNEEALEEYYSKKKKLAEILMDGINGR